MSHPFLLIDMFMPLPLLLRPILGNAIPTHRPPGSQLSQESLHCAIAGAVSAQIVSTRHVGDAVYQRGMQSLAQDGGSIIVQLTKEVVVCSYWSSFLLQ